ncbi:MAG: hypothetical protein Q4B58_06130 [Bacteroidales bacterium]|nr:hypothetical protein [Bacteroidales bacterium]
MGIIDKIKALLASDDDLLGKTSALQPEKGDFVVPAEINADTVLKALVEYGKTAGYVKDENKQAQNDVLLASVKNQVIKMHEEVLGYYRRKNLMPDEKLLNRLTIENMFYLAMGTAILVKVKKTNLIASGFFGKMMKKAGPDYFYREVASMAGNKYGDAQVEQLHQHVQKAVYKLLVSFDTQPNARNLVIECAKAVYMYGLTVTIIKKENNVTE